MGPRALRLPALAADTLLAAERRRLLARPAGGLDGEPLARRASPLAHIALGLALTHQPRHLPRAGALIVLSIGIVLADIRVRVDRHRATRSCSAGPISALAVRRRSSAPARTRPSRVDQLVDTGHSGRRRRRGRPPRRPHPRVGAACSARSRLAAFQRLGVRRARRPRREGTARRRARRWNSAAGRDDPSSRRGRLQRARRRRPRYRSLGWTRSRSTAVAHVHRARARGRRAGAATLAAEAARARRPRPLADDARRLGGLRASPRLSLTHTLGTLATPDALIRWASDAPARRRRARSPRPRRRAVRDQPRRPLRVRTAAGGSSRPTAARDGAVPGQRRGHHAHAGPDAHRPDAARRPAGRSAGVGRACIRGLLTDDRQAAPSRGLALLALTVGEGASSTTSRRWRSLYPRRVAGRPRAAAAHLARSRGNGSAQGDELTR